MTGWTGAYTEGFSARIKVSTLRRDRTCACRGCRACTLGRGCRRPSELVDHRTSWQECKRMGLDPNVAENAQGMCAECHSVKTAGEIARGRRRLTPVRTTRHPSEGVGEVTPPPVDASTDGRAPAYAYDPPSNTLRARLTRYEE